MNLDEAKTKIILDDLRIDLTQLGRIYTYIDFGNVNYWYEKDRRDDSGAALREEEKIVVSINRLGEFVNRFSTRSLFYYGLDESRPSSLHLIKKARNQFSSTITKPIQLIRHYIQTDDKATSRTTEVDDQGHRFIVIQKCNFDVELCLDVTRMADKFDTLCLFSSDNDFGGLLEHVKKRAKKNVILIHGSSTRIEFKRKADITINAQRIKKYITIIKRPNAPLGGEGLDIGPVSTGRAPLAEHD
ncbi:MAG: NYN domain-containing protein [Patescibacteria group bacterium]